MRFHFSGRILVGSIAGAVLLYSIGMISYKLINQAESKIEYESFQAIYTEAHRLKNTPEPVSVLFPSPAIESDQMAGPPPKHVRERFKELLLLNPDTVGWITIQNSNIDYPVVQAEDNDYYLHHSFQRKKNAAGAVFMDFRNQSDENNYNTILYGHQMKNGTMFQTLDNYLDKTFFEENRYIQFDNLYQDRKWEVFSVYITPVSFNYIRTKFESDHDYSDFLRTIADKSLHSAEVDLHSGDRILTLSTCNYEFDNARLVVHAKLVEEG